MTYIGYLASLTSIDGCFQIIEGVKRLVEIDGDACHACTRQARRITYDARGLVTRRTGFNGSVTDYRYNARRCTAKGSPVLG